MKILLARGNLWDEEFKLVPARKGEDRGQKEEDDDGDDIRSGLAAGICEKAPNISELRLGSAQF